MARKRNEVNLVTDPVARAVEMFRLQTDAAKEGLNPKPKRNPLRDMLPPGVTLKQFAEELDA